MNQNVPLTRRLTVNSKQSRAVRVDPGAAPGAALPPLRPARPQLEEHARAGDECARTPEQSEGVRPGHLPHRAEQGWEDEPAEPAGCTDHASHNPDAIGKSMRHQ